ncbi:GTP-binding protein hflX [Actinobacillus equuli]|nr:GTP-binding protein hflX [Actinobacillus equuli]
MPNTDENAVFGFALSENGKTSDKELSHTKDKAILVHLFLSQHKDIENLMEFQTLAESAGVEILATLTTSRSAPHIKYLSDKVKPMKSLKRLKNSVQP